MTDRERAAVDLLRRLYEREAGRTLADSSMFEEWLDDEIMAFIREYGPFETQLREEPS